MSVTLERRRSVITGITGFLFPNYSDDSRPARSRIHQARPIFRRFRRRLIPGTLICVAGEHEPLPLLLLADAKCSSAKGTVHVSAMPAVAAARFILDRDGVACSSCIRPLRDADTRSTALITYISKDPGDFMQLTIKRRYSR